MHISIEEHFRLSADYDPDNIDCRFMYDNYKKVIKRAEFVLFKLNY